MIIGVMGESGSGKTTSLRNLNPETTYIIDCDKKGLVWKGWKNDYSTDKKNYSVTDNSREVLELLCRINLSESAQHIKTLVIDTLNGIMIADEIRRMREKGYDKWQDLAVSIWGLIDKALDVREDLNIIFICHAQTDRDDYGNVVQTRIKTSGRKLDKIVLESKFNMVLLAKSDNGKYYFETQANNSTAKSPMGLFEEREIDNDLQKVLIAIAEYQK